MKTATSLLSEVQRNGAERITSTDDTGYNDEIDTLRCIASTYYKDDKLSLALESYNKLILASPSDINVTYDRALCLSKMGYIDEAIEGFETALVLIKTHRRNGEQQQRQQTDHRPSKEEVQLANALLEGRGEKQRALEIYQRAGPNSALVMLAGVCLDSLGRHDEARSCYQQALRLKGGDADHEAMVHLCINTFRRCRSFTGKDYGDTISISTKEEEDMENIVRKVEESSSRFIASSWRYISNTPDTWKLPAVHYFTYDMVQLAMKSATLDDGLILEFGVYYGKTIRMIADYFPNHVIHGFDTFEGLPSDWFATKQGSYSTNGNIPVVQSNVKFYKGLFSDTLPFFLEEQQLDKPVRLMNIDCDMYASTKDIFDILYDRIRPGTIILFDEYVGNPHWKEDEYKAFQEAVEKNGWNYKYIAISMVSQQAIVQII